MDATTGIKALALSVLGAALLAPAARADFDVNTTTDPPPPCVSGTVSLRCAVNAANAASGADIINVPAGDYHLTNTGSGEDEGLTGDLDITESVTIAGAGAGTTTIHGVGDRIFDALSGAGTGTLAISGLTLTGATDTGDGAAIFADAGTLTLSDDVITGNATAVSTDGRGGGVFYTADGVGTLEISNTTISSNTANGDSGGSGGAITFAPGAGTSTLTVTDSTFDSNTAAAGGGGGLGGAIEITAPVSVDVTLTRSTFIDNTAEGPSGGSGGGFGGALSFEPGLGDNTLTVTDSTFDSNTAGSGDTGGGGFGGALEIEPAGAVTTTVTGSTFVGNVADGPPSTDGGFGGAMHVDPGDASSPLNITNSTFNGNQANGPGGFGGAVEFESGTAMLTNVTIAGNSAPVVGGFDNAADDASSANSIIANNTGGDCDIQITDVGENLDSDDSCGFAEGGQDPNLSPLADNGGPTMTMALKSPSPAIDAGVNGSCESEDQRHAPRPFDGDGDTVADCDLGAFEFGSTPSGGDPFAVNTTSDLASCPPGTVSLRCAVIAANATPGPNTITVPAGDYQLTIDGNGEDAAMTGDLDITSDDLTIMGAGDAPTTIHATPSGFTPGDRIFDVVGGAGGGAIEITGLTLTGGNSVPSGGAIQAKSGSLTLINDVIASNTTSDLGTGGGVFFQPDVAGDVTITNTTFTSNTAAVTGATGNGFGGAISFRPSSAPSDLTITDSTFDDNEAQAGSTTGGGFGGAIDASSVGVGTVTVTGSTFASNTARGPASGGLGGAIYFATDITAQLNITNSTFNANQALGSNGFGGAVEFESGTAALTNVTIAANVAGGAGGGFNNENTDLAASFANSIVANNSGGDCSNFAVGDVGENLDSDGTCGFSLTPADPNLAALADNGGPTMTMALQSPSPAIDAGDNGTCAATDQRGFARPIDGDGDTVATCDLGAYELGAGPPPSGGGGGGGSTPPSSTTTSPSGTAQILPPPPPGPGGIPIPFPLRTGNLTPVSGVVRVRLPTSLRFVRIETLTSIPVGTLIDATKGVVILTVARDRQGHLQTGEFSRGAFYFTQAIETLRVFGSNPLRTLRTLVTELRMARGVGNPLSCPRGSSGRIGAGPREDRSSLKGNSTRKRFVRYLQAKAAGKFRVIGRHSSGIERGTSWLTRDDCGGTLTRVQKGQVIVTDYVKRRDVLVRTGKSYLATGRP